MPVAVLTGKSARLTRIVARSILSKNDQQNVVHCVCSDGNSKAANHKQDRKHNTRQKTECERVPGKDVRVGVECEDLIVHGRKEETRDKDGRRPAHAIRTTAQPHNAGRGRQEHQSKQQLLVKPRSEIADQLVHRANGCVSG